MHQTHATRVSGFRAYARRLTPETSQLTSLERRVTSLLSRRRPELVDLTAALVGFDTTASVAGEEGGEEAALQELLAARLRSNGLAVDLFEPGPGDIPESPMLADGHDLTGRPQLIARRDGTGGGGRSLLLNGHVDVVETGCRELWSSDPFRARVDGGLLYGRGTCDMKGGVAAMVLAVEALCELDVPLRGDLLVNTVTDEESTGAGSLACVARGLRADGCVIPEPTSGKVWLGFRGVLMPTVEVEGRAGHTGLARGDGSDGPGVDAIEAMLPVLAALRALREGWWSRRSPGEVPGWIVPTHITAGQWIVTYPESCRLDLHVTYSARQADEDGWGTRVRREIEDHLQAAFAADEWLAAHPPRISWSANVPASAVDADDPIVRTALQAAAALSHPSGIADETTWIDAATYTRAGTPAIGFGPGDIRAAHTVDEYVEIDELVRAAQRIAVHAMRFCGVQDGEVDSRPRPRATVGGGQLP